MYIHFFPVNNPFSYMQNGHLSKRFAQIPHVFIYLHLTQSVSLSLETHIIHLVSSLIPSQFNTRKICFLRPIPLPFPNIRLNVCPFTLYVCDHNGQSSSSYPLYLSCADLRPEIRFIFLFPQSAHSNQSKQCPKP